MLNIEITVIKSDKSWEDYWRFYKCKHTPFGTLPICPHPKNDGVTEVLKLIPYEIGWKKIIQIMLFIVMSDYELTKSTTEKAFWHLLRI